MTDSKKIPLRTQVETKYKWRIEDLYAQDCLWEEDFKKSRDEISKLKAYKGTLKKSAKQMVACLQACDKVGIVVEKLYLYSNMRFHEDSGVSQYQDMSIRAEGLVVQYSEAVSFIQPEIISIEESTLQLFQEEPVLKEYAHFIENIMRQKAHTLSEKEEALLSRVGEISSGAQNIFTMINDADIKFGEIQNEKGEPVELTKGRYTTFLESNDRGVRKRAFDALYASYLSQKNTIAATYYTNVKADVFFAKTRGYASSVAMALADDNIPISVYDNLIETVHKYLPLMHRYVALRKKLLKVDELHMYDLYAPLVQDYELKISYEQAKQKVLEGLAPLGSEYSAFLKQGFDGGWIDVYENKGKRGGAYSWGMYTSHPFVLLNHNDNINSMFTIAHEMGHALHSFYTWKSMPYVYADHKIFVAEVASTCNEALLMEHLLQTTKDKQLLKYLINYYMEQFRGTLFRQTMFAEFEKLCHETVENGGSLTAEGMMSLYHDLNRQYFGSDIVVDEAIDIEWARIPHFYNSFYVYQYATGYSAAIALSKKILEEGAPAVKNYTDFLSKGTSAYAIDLLKGAGVDMTEKAPLENALKVFEGLLNKMERMQE